MNKFKQLIKSTGIYFLGNVLAKVVSFFMLPIYTRFISTEGMGYYDLTNSYLNIIVPLVCLTIWSGALRFIFDYSKEQEKNKVIYNSNIILGCGTIAFTIGIFVLNYMVGVQYVEFIFLVGIATIFQNYYSCVARALGYNSIFAISGIVGSFLNCFTNICLILGAHMEETSLFISLAVGLLAQVMIMESKIKVRKIVFAKQAFKQFDKSLVARLVRYSVPLAMNSVCYWFLSSYNRIGVSNVLGLEANGIYAIAGKYAYAISLFSNAFSLAVQELLYRTGSESDDKEGTYTLLSTNYMKMLMLGLSLILPAIQITFPLLIGQAYNAAYPLIPLYLLATVFSIYSLFLGDVFAAEKQTKYVIVTTIPGAIINIILFHVLVPILGVQAANISLMLGFLMLIVNRIVILRKVTVIKIDFKMLVGVFALFVGSYIVYLLNNWLLSIGAFAVCTLISFYAFRDLLKKVIKR